jgi:hypothetical protein
MYTLLVCADLFGEKINLEITFPAMPTIGELQMKVNASFDAEGASKRPQGYPAVEFSVARLQVYDDVLLKWADLVTCSQLHEYDQLYAFQPQSPWHVDVQKDLPPPRPAAQTRMPPAAPNTPSTYHDSPYQQQQQQQPHYAAASPATPNNVSHIHNTTAQNRSPQQDRLEANRQREEQLRAELAKLHDSNQSLEREAERERVEMSRRHQQDQEHAMRHKEQEIQRQREQLRAMEAEYQRDATNSSQQQQQQQYGNQPRY